MHDLNQFNKKILIVGPWLWPQYEEAFSRGLEKLGYSVIGFSTSRYFRGKLGRLMQRTYLPIGMMTNLNSSLIRKVKQESPQVVLFWRPVHIRGETVKEIQRLGVVTVSYNNDDPFASRFVRKSPWFRRIMWHWYNECLPIFDINFFYRRINCDEAQILGAKRPSLLMPYFIPERDRPITLDGVELKTYTTDVVFVGHFEDDGRDEYIRKLIDSGVNIKLWGGPEWYKRFSRQQLDKLGSISLADGDRYTKALTGAKICLAFLSRLNRDSYTRRCFEIPGTGKLMLAERTDDLLSMFKENEEACFFSDSDELLAKVHWLLKNPIEVERIAEAGKQRVWKDQHDVNSRARQFADNINNFLERERR